MRNISIVNRTERKFRLLNDVDVHPNVVAFTTNSFNGDFYALLNNGEIRNKDDEGE